MFCALSHLAKFHLAFAGNSLRVYRPNQLISFGQIREH
jgi:hypothetical protein